MKELTYISTDIEYSGESKWVLWQWSLLSLWSCELWNINNSFYSEIKPINRIYNDGAMWVIWPGFKYIWDHPEKMTSGEILDALQQFGDTPKEAFTKYTHWLSSFDWSDLKELACPIKFDGGLTAYYFREFIWENPLWFSGEDGNSMLRWFLRDTNISFSRLWIQKLWWSLPHNALQDSQIQAIWMEFLLYLMKFDKQNNGETSAIYQREWKQKFLDSREVTRSVEWVKDAVISIKSTDFWKNIPYTSIL